MAYRAQPWWSLFYHTIGDVGAKQRGVIQKEGWRRSPKQAPANPRGQENLRVLQCTHCEVLVLHCKHFPSPFPKDIPFSGTCVALSEQHYKYHMCRNESSVTLFSQYFHKIWGPCWAVSIDCLYACHRRWRNWWQWGIIEADVRCVWVSSTWKQMSSSRAFLCCLMDENPDRVAHYRCSSWASGNVWWVRLTHSVDAAPLGTDNIYK